VVGPFVGPLLGLVEVGAPDDGPSLGLLDDGFVVGLVVVGRDVGSTLGVWLVGVSVNGALVGLADAGEALGPALGPWLVGIALGLVDVGLNVGSPVDVIMVGI
jgi:hypothetical protein